LAARKVEVTSFTVLPPILAQFHRPERYPLYLVAEYVDSLPAYRGPGAK
jgi:hypothetical protein